MTYTVTASCDFFHTCSGRLYSQVLSCCNQDSIYSDRKNPDAQLFVPLGTTFITEIIAYVKNK